MYFILSYSILFLTHYGRTFMNLKKHTRSFPIRAIILCALSFNPWFALTAHAQGVSGWAWSGRLGNLNIDSDTAEEQYVDDAAVIVGFAGELYTDTSDFTFTIGADFISYDDKATFRQLTTGGDKRSSASGFMLFAEYGPKLHFGVDKSNFFVAHGGVSVVLGSERSIGYCTDCYSEDIELDGGAYGLLGIGHSFSSVELSLQFQQYFTGDFDNSLNLKLSSVF
jgi:hypothetical protein